MCVVGTVYPCAAPRNADKSTRRRSHCFILHVGIDRTETATVQLQLTENVAVILLCFCFSFSFSLCSVLVLLLFFLWPAENWRCNPTGQKTDGKKTKTTGVINNPSEAVRT